MARWIVILMLLMPMRVWSVQVPANTGLRASLGMGFDSLANRFTGSHCVSASTYQILDMQEQIQWKSNLNQTQLEEALTAGGGFGVTLPMLYGLGVRASAAYARASSSDRLSSTYHVVAQYRGVQSIMDHPVLQPRAKNLIDRMITGTAPMTATQSMSSSHLGFHDKGGLKR